jgi:hypothetical protein
MSESSSENNSSSPSAPMSPRGIQIPDDSILIQYNSVDPTRVLDNPSQYIDDFYQLSVDEKVGCMLVELLQKYQELSYNNMELSIYSIKHKLQKDQMKYNEIYDLVDKFFVDTPNTTTIPSSFITSDALKLFTKKQVIHEEIEQKLKNFNEMIEKLKEGNIKSTDIKHPEIRDEEPEENNELDNYTEHKEVDKSDISLSTKKKPLKKNNMKNKKSLKNTTPM